MENKDDIVIVSAVRTPFSRFESAMKDIPSIKLGVMVMKEVIERVGIKPEEVDEINYGSCLPAEFALETDVSGEASESPGRIPRREYLFIIGQGMLFFSDGLTPWDTRH